MALGTKEGKLVRPLSKVAPVKIVIRFSYHQFVTYLMIVLYISSFITCEVFGGARPSSRACSGLRPHTTAGSMAPLAISIFI